MHDFAGAIERERLRNLLGRTGCDERVTGKNFEVFIRCGVGGFAADNGNDRDTNNAVRTEASNADSSSTNKTVSLPPRIAVGDASTVG